MRAKSFRITVPFNLKAYNQFQFRLTKAIDNPMSTAPSNAWYLLSNEGASLTSTEGLVAEQGEVTQIQISPVSQRVGASTDVVFKWRGQHAVPKGSSFKIKFPTWNALNPQISEQKTYIQGAVKCTPQVILSNDLFCTLLGDTLHIHGGVPSQITAGSDIIISMTGFKNPIDTALKEGFEITSYQRVGGEDFPIDFGKGSLKVEEYAVIDGGKLEVINESGRTAGLIQQNDEMQLSFYMPVPLDEGCQVKVTLPSQYSTEFVKRVAAMQMFGSY